MNKEFKILSIKLKENSKAPLELWGQESNRYNYEDIENHSGIGIIPPEGIQVVDVDDEATMKTIDNMLEHLNIKTLTLTTTKGKHYWFKSDETNGAAGQISLSTLKVDYRNNKNYLVIKMNGVNRVWNNEWVNAMGPKMIFEQIIADLPLFLKPSDRKLEPALNLGDGDGRNDYFMKSYITPIVQQGYNDNLRELMDIINDYVFLEPLPSIELDNLLKDDNYRDNIEIKKHTPMKNNKLEDKEYLEKEKIAKEIQSVANLKYSDTVFWTKNEDTGGYSSISPGSNEVFELITKPLLRTKAVHREDIRGHLKALAMDTPTNYGDNTLNLKGGFINIDTEVFTPYGENDFPTQVLNTGYDSSAYNKDVDDFLNQSMKGDKDLRSILEESIGALLFDKDTKHHKALLFEGMGSNGKSTFMDAITQLIGPEHVSFLDTNALNEKHSTVALVGKMLNVTDDLNPAALKNTGTIKTVISGGRLNINPKGQEPFSYKVTAKLMFAANKVPVAVGEHNHGWERRFINIKWENQVRGADIDRSLLSKLTTDEAKKYWINLGVQGWKRLEAQNGYTQSDKVIARAKELREQNDSAIAFIKDQWYEVFENAVKKNKEGKGILLATGVYMAYKRWCGLRGYSPFNENNFRTNIEQNGEEHGVTIKNSHVIKEGSLVRRYTVYIIDNRGDVQVSAKPFRGSEAF